MSNSQSPVHLGHGSFVLYTGSGPHLPPWPAVLCPDSMAPRSVMRDRPHGYYMLILLMGQQREFQWVTQGQILEFNPSVLEKHLNKRPGLRQAYECALAALQEGANLDHWRAVTMDLREKDSISDSENTEFELDSDEEMKLAIKASLEDFEGKKTHDINLESSTDSSQGSLPVFRRARPMKARTYPPSTGGLGVTVIKGSSPSKTPEKRKHTGRSHAKESRLRAYNVPKKSPPAQSPKQRTGIGILDQKEPGLYRKNIREKTPTDIVEDLLDDPQFIQFQIGPEKELFSIPFKDVKDKGYFNHKDSQCLTPYGRRGWMFDRPVLSQIDPQGFALAAQWLSTGDFGHVRAEGEDEAQRAEAFAQCVITWETADSLGMHDLLEHIVKKIEWILPWDMNEVLVFSEIVYRIPGAPLEMYGEMKAMLSKYLAENFWEYVNSDYHREFFVRAIRAIPELEADIHRLRAERLVGASPASCSDSGVIDEASSESSEK